LPHFRASRPIFYACLSGNGGQHRNQQRGDEDSPKND
jgi:hypothetical protein